MPKLAEIREIDGAIWARVEMEAGSPVQFLTSAEIDANAAKWEKLLTKIDQLTDALDRIRYVEGCPKSIERIALDALDALAKRTP